jgi:pyruvate dehydrogenase E2 component (dihydrolipoamide acetyltransferase)
VPIEVTMPKLSPTMETGVIAQWLVKVGDQVKEGDVLADIETDKATMQMKAYDDGIIVQLDHAAGEEVALGERVMVLAGKGEDPKQVAAGIGAASAPPTQTAGREPRPGDSEKTAAETSDNGQQDFESPPAESAGERRKASPLARKMAESAQVDLARVRGTGPGGRIIRRDIEAYLSGTTIDVPEPKQNAQAAEPTIAKVPEQTSQAAAPPVKAPTAPAALPPRPAPAIPAAPSAAAQRIPHSRMRKTIAQRMVQAKQTAPEIHVTVDIRVDKLVAIREDLNRQLAAEQVKLSLGDFVTKAVAMALRRHPGLNASYDQEAIVRHGEINVGIAVALDAGLIVPVLHRADSLGLVEIRRRSEALATAARSGGLTSEQLTGATFTISNLGMYGVRQFDAILNLPEVGILAVGAAEKRPVVEGDALVRGTVLSVTLTADHRAVDGAMAADFLRTLKRLLEEPSMMLL